MHGSIIPVAIYAKRGFKAAMTIERFKLSGIITIFKACIIIVMFHGIRKPALESTVPSQLFLIGDMEDYNSLVENYSSFDEDNVWNVNFKVSILLKWIFKCEANLNCAHIWLTHVMRFSLILLDVCDLALIT